jgi:putative nucleotidyltransferase with HDIG domain
MAQPAHILIVDDDPTIRDLLAEGLSESGYRCATARDGAEGLRRLRQNGYELVVSDIDMPEMDGVQLLQEVKRFRPDTEIIMLTGLVDVETAIQSMRLGACDYLTKPFNLAEVRITVERALEKRRLVLENREYQRHLEERVRERTAELSRSYQTTLEALATALDTRDSETLGHSLRVAAYTVAVARRMGVTEPELTDLYRGALLHDVGKIGIPDAILRKPGRLTPEEWNEMRRHPELGYRILAGIDFMERARQIVLSHQERYDGRGYPRGLKGKEIPLGARIFAVVDTLDAMISDRPYRKALGYERARLEIRKHCGTQFDPDVVRAFLEISEADWRAIQEKVMQEVLTRGLSRG